MAGVMGMYPQAILEAASKELGDWLMKRICLGWEEEFKHHGRFPASEALDADVSWG